MIEDDAFDAEVRADLAVERSLFWRGLASLGMVLVMLTLRTLFFT